jgi:hypothetical protein
MIAASGNQAFSLFGCEPADTARWLFWLLHHDMRAPTAFGRVLYDRRNRRVELPIAGRSGCVRIDLARTDTAERIKAAIAMVA